MKPAVLVTGGTGYIGSHTAVELINNGFDVISADNLYNSEAWINDRIGMITGKAPVLEIIDVCDESALDDLFRRHPSVKAVIHFAAYKAVGESVNKPLEYYRNNILSTISLLEMMKKHNVRHMVFSSSCTVYGQPDILPVTEDTPLKPAASPYGNTKKICEDIIKDCTSADKNLRAISLRYFNPIGAHSSGLIGELPRGVPENLVPFITQTAIGLREELKVFGNDYNTPDGTCIRDYLHVTDLSLAHVKAVVRLLNGENKSGYEVFNLGAGKGVSVMEAIESFMRVTGIKLKYRITGRRHGDIEKIWADPSLANRELGWKTIYTLDDAMKTAWLWEKNLKEMR